MTMPAPLLPAALLSATLLSAPLVGAALLLAACSAEPVTGNTPAAPTGATPGPDATPGPVSSPGRNPAARDADSRATPAPGELKTFTDWTVGCDNAKACTMASLGAESGGDFPLVTLALRRAAGPDGGYDVKIAGEAEGTPAALEVDGRRFPVARDGLAGASANALAGAIADGHVLIARDGSGRSLGRVSLAGASAALRYIDAAQGRAGTVTATVAKGPATTVPAAPALPVVVARAPSGSPATPTAAQLADMRRIGRCDAQRSGDAMWAPDVAALGGGATLVILPCSTGAYNLIGALFVIRDGRVTAADVDNPSGFEETGADSQTAVHSVVNGAFDGGVLTSFAKGRGLGDCGVAQGYAWDGARFRLVDQSQMGECRGPREYIITWRARVVRR